MNLAVISAHAGAESLSEAVLSWGNEVPVYIINGGTGMIEAYQRGYLKTPDYDLLAYLHDDTLIHDPMWVYRVMKQFDDPTVGVVGFGGARGSGTPDIYKSPYDYRQLARQGFMSNMVDAEAHGTRFTGDRDVAVLDGFAMIVRRELLDKTGGWPLGTPIGYINYDMWLCSMARRLGYRIRLCGVPCAHLGGQTFVKKKIGEREDHWAKYLAAHEYCYNEFRDVIPFEVGR